MDRLARQRFRLIRLKGPFRVFAPAHHILSTKERTFRSVIGYARNRGFASEGLQKRAKRQLTAFVGFATWGRPNARKNILHDHVSRPIACRRTHRSNDQKARGFLCHFPWMLEEGEIPSTHVSTHTHTHHAASVCVVTCMRIAYTESTKHLHTHCKKTAVSRVSVSRLCDLHLLICSSLDERTKLIYDVNPDQIDY